MTSASLRPGRCLSISPSWPDESARIAFDRHSGDYWLLTPAAAALLQALLDGAADVPAGPLVDELVKAGLLQPPP